MSLVRMQMPALRDLTNARVALPTVGNSIATSEVLAFQQAHALARDAVHARVDFVAMAARIIEEIPALHEAPVLLKSNARDRATYLRQPHLGRTLQAESAMLLKRTQADLAIVIADGLSSTAVECNVVPLLHELVPLLVDGGWSMAPITLVEQGRVAIGDPIGEALGARCSLVLLGERPGLSCSDSLGAYLTWEPRSGRTDAERNCISNIHAHGLQPAEAAQRILRLLQGARALGGTGTALKDDGEHPLLAEVH